MAKKQLGWVVLCALVLPASPMLSQQPELERIRYAATCAPCRIQFTKLFTLGAPTDPVLLTKSPVFARDARGRFFSASFDNAQVVVFDSTGSFLTVVGRSGAGPGEFPVMPQGPTEGPQGRIAKVVVGRGDSVFVFEDGGRVSVIAPELRIVRSFRLPISGNIGDVHALPNGAFVAGARVPTAAHIGQSMFLFDSNGKIVTGLGADSSVGGSSAPAFPAMNFVPSHDARSIWTYNSRFKLEQWSLTNIHLRSLEVAGVPWLPVPKVEMRQGRAGRPPYPVTVGSGQLLLVGQDSRGRLWFSGRGPVDEGQTSSAPRRVEVFDPERRELVISQQAPTPEIVWLFPRSETGYSAHSNSDGVRYYTIRKVSFGQSTP
jgi:hypothetical protein